ncbi:MAG: winged helix-turn-helix domain-containing protein [Fimbriimonadales bacterium]|nr:winged helix-turn-helix domain-containing protein [Fimbriimonadales bacterium]
MLYRFGEFELDTAAREIRKGRAFVKVEPQVFDVLVYLISNADRVVAKDELLEKVWGDAFVSEATLSSRIMAARKAIGDSGKEQQLIRTIHSRGFRFVGELKQSSMECEDATETTVSLLEAAKDRILTADMAGASAKLESAKQRLSSSADYKDREWAHWHILMAQLLLQLEGWSSESAREHYDKAIDIAEGIGDVEVFRSARYHLATMFELRADFMQSETLMKAAITEPTGDASDAESRELLACSLFHQGRFSESGKQATSGIEIGPTKAITRLSAFYGEDPLVSCHHWLALSLLFMGDEDAALRNASKALRLSEQHGRIHSLAHSRQQAAMLHQVRRDLDLCEHWARATVSIGTRQNLPYRKCAGTILLCWATGMKGDPKPVIGEMVSNLEQMAAIGARMEEPYFAALIAECEIAADDKKSAIFRLNNLLNSDPVKRGYFYTAEILRLRAIAECNGQSKQTLEHAIDLATRQGAQYLVSRCTDSLNSI